MKIELKLQCFQGKVTINILPKIENFNSELNLNLYTIFINENPANILACYLSMFYESPTESPTSRHIIMTNCVDNNLYCYVQLKFNFNKFVINFQCLLYIHDLYI